MLRARRALDPPERAAHRVDLGAVIVEAVLHLHVDRPAQRIETERGIVGHHRDRPYRGGRDQIPVYRVAEGLVDANAVLVNREPLGSAGHRGGDEAAKLHVGLEGIAGNFIDDDTRHVFLQGIADVQRPGLLDLVGVDEVDARRHLLGIDAGARYRRGRVYHQLGYGPGDSSGVLGAAGLGARLRSGHHDGRQRLDTGRFLGAGTIGPRTCAYRDDKYRHDKQESSAHLPHPIPLRLFGGRRFREC
jgi:hypothetical protein